MAGDTRRSNPRVPNRYMALIDGSLKVEDLTDEEILKGQLMDKNGGFQGRAPLAIPREFHQAVVRELIRRMEQKMQKNMDAMVATLVEMATSRRTPAEARYKAAVYVIERIMGKIPDKQIVQATIAKWEDNIGDLFVDLDDEEEEDLPAPVPQPRRRAASGK